MVDHVIFIFYGSDSIEYMFFREIRECAHKGHNLAYWAFFFVTGQGLFPCFPLLFLFVHEGDGEGTDIF
jgi:hypothetical protein